MERTPIYILGIGNLGKLVAHSLRKQSPTTPVTLLLHRESLLSDWAAAGQTIECRTPNGPPDRRNGFSVEPLSGQAQKSAHGPIRNLIVATKTYMTAAALAPIKHRLGRDSNVLFLQNGMGTHRKYLLPYRYCWLSI
jgi:2-dehydropantoate 2-reductase